ncbi:ATP-binding protein [Candidatus Dependentiae bacterium]|nr:ATP-binding protein [Candidatus Dependentiae bacterium]
MLHIVLLLALCYLETSCMTQSLPQQPPEISTINPEQQAINILAYNAYLKIIINRPSIDTAELLQQLTQQGITCSASDLETFKQLSVNLNHTISDRLERETNNMMPTLAGMLLELYQTIEDLYLQGIPIDEIYKQIDGNGFGNILSKSMLQKITQGIEEKKHLILGNIPDQMCLVQIQQLIAHSPHPSKLLEALRGITEKTSDPLMQLKILEIFAEKMGIQESSIIGPDSIDINYIGELPEVLQRLCDQYKHSEKYPDKLSSAKQSILFLGEPGTGKTFTARAFAKELHAGLLEINCSQLLDKYVGESEKKLEDLIKQAERYTNHFGRCLVFFDEFDTIARRRGERGMEHIHTTLNRLLSIIEQKNNNPNLIFIAATNSQLGDLDPALTRSGRFGIHIEFKLPTWSERKHHLSIIIETNYAQNIDQGSVDLESLARLTDGFSPADLKKIVDNAIKLACYHKRTATMRDFLQEIDVLQRDKHAQRKKRER